MNQPNTLGKKTTPNPLLFLIALLGKPLVCKNRVVELQSNNSIYIAESRRGDKKTHSWDLARNRRGVREAGAGEDAGRIVAENAVMRTAKRVGRRRSETAFKAS